MQTNVFVWGATQENFKYLKTLSNSGSDYNSSKFQSWGALAKDLRMLWQGTFLPVRLQFMANKIIFLVLSISCLQMNFS